MFLALRQLSDFEFLMAPRRSLLSSFARGIRGGVFTLTFARLNLRIRNHLFRTLMRQEIGFFDENHTGDIETRETHLSFSCLFIVNKTC